MRIMMIGPHLKVKGGISSLEKILMENHNESNIKLEMASSMNDFWILGRITNFLILLLLFPVRILFKRPDVVHIHFSHGMSTWRKQILLRLWKLTGARVIMHSHSSKFKQFFPRLPKFLRSYVSKGLQNADKIIVLSESWKTFYAKECGVNPDNIYILPTPSMLPVITDNDQSSDNIVLFSGRVGERKGTFDLINAWSKIPESLLSVFRLVITGDGKISEAKSMVKKLGLENNIKVTGWLKDEDFNNYLKNCLIYVLPSNNEGLPMGLIEAMAYKKAVITTPVGGIPELITDQENGLLVEPGNPEELSLAIKKLMEDESLREYLSENARKSVEPLGIKNYFKKLYLIWREDC